MGSDMTTQREHIRMRLLETNKVVDANLRREDLWDHESNSQFNTSLTRCKDPFLNAQKFSTNTDAPLTDASNQNKGKCSRGTFAGESLLQNTRYIVINNRVYKDPRSTSHLDMLSPTSTDIGSTKALAGLIIMCNDRIRRSFLKYGVFGVPLAKKPILDRVGASTKLFLFEFEARALWGIYVATSEASLDIEKDAYRGSDVSFAAQVKVCTYKQCGPLPEKLFQLAIEDNYFTPTKFNFELTEKQVSNLTKLYCMQEMEKSRIDGRNMSSAGFPHETAGSDSLSEAQDGTVYQADNATMDDRATPAHDIQKNMPYTEMLQTSSRLNRLSQSGLVRSGGNTEANFCIRGKHLASAEYDALENFSLDQKDDDVAKTQKDYPTLKKQELTDTIGSDRNGGHARRSSLHADAKSTLLDPTTTTLFRYPHEEESSLLEDDLRYQRCQFKSSNYKGEPTYESSVQGMHYKGDPTYESRVQGMGVRPCIPFANLPDAVFASNRIFKPSPNEEHYQRMLTPRDDILLRQLPLRSPDEHLRTEASFDQRLGERTSSRDEALWDSPCASKDISKPCSKTHIPRQVISTHPAQFTPATSGYHDIQHVSGNGYATQGLPRRCPTYQKYLTMPGEACRENHDNGFVSMDKVCACTRTGVLPDDEAMHGKFYHERLSSRRKLPPDDAQAQVENITCFAKSATARSNYTDTDDDATLLRRSTPCAVNSFVQRRHEVEEDDEARLENARRLVKKSFTSNKCGDGAEDCFENGKQDDSSTQVENQVLKSLLRILRKQPRFTVNDDNLQVREGDVKPRQSVWSRLSTSRKTFDSRVTSKDPVLPDEALGELQFSTRSLPWKRTISCILPCPTHPSENDVGTIAAIEEECLVYETNEVNVDFKRRKRPGNPSDTNVRMDTVIVKESEPMRNPCENQRERRRIRRPL